MNIRVALTSVAIVLLSLERPSVAHSAQSLDYNQGIRTAQAAISSGNHQKAERVLAQLTKRYPDNPELLAMHGRVLFWMKRYGEAHRILKHAYSIQRSEALLKEVKQAEAFISITSATKLLEAGKTAAGEAQLHDVYRSGTASYDAGILLARSRYERGAFAEAAAVLAELVITYPREKDLRPRYVQSLINTGNEWQAITYIDSLPEQELDAELLASRARILFKIGDLRGAIKSYTPAIVLQPDKDVSAELEKVERARELKKADTLLAAGKSSEADAFLTAQCSRQETRYDGCRKLAALASRSGDHQRAATVYEQLVAAYPSEPDFMLLHAQELVHLQKLNEASTVLNAYPDQNNATLLSLRGGIAFYRKDNKEAVLQYSRVVAVSNDPESVSRLNSARTSLALEAATRHLERKEYSEAETILTDQYKNSSDQYSAGLMLGRVFFALRKEREAATLYRELEQRYPKEPDLTGLRVEAHIMAREYKEAVTILRNAPAAVQEYLAREREDLLYRTAVNWLKLSGGIYQQSGTSSTSESNLALAVSQRVGQYSLSAWTGATTKFSRTDSQIGLELASGKGEKSPFWWNINGAVSPEARILPRTTVGADVTRGFTGFEASLGFTRMDFTDSGVSILIPGVLWYIPNSTFSLSERLYIVPDNGGYTTLTTLHHEPDHRFRWFASIGLGTSSDRISVKQDYERLTTVSARIGTEYRYTPRYSIGAEASYESRGKMYDRSGASLYMRYWWQ